MKREGARAGERKRHADAQTDGGSKDAMSMPMQCDEMEKEKEKE